MFSTQIAVIKKYISQFEILKPTSPGNTGKSSELGKLAVGALKENNISGLKRRFAHYIVQNFPSFTQIWKGPSDKRAEGKHPFGIVGVTAPFLFEAKLARVLKPTRRQFWTGEGEGSEDRGMVRQAPAIPINRIFYGASRMS